MTEAHVCEQLAEGRYLTAKRPSVELATSRVASQRPNHYTTRPRLGISGLGFYRPMMSPNQQRQIIEGN